MFALCVPQPYAEEILRGLKTRVYRDQPIARHFIWETVYLYVETSDALGQDIDERYEQLGCDRGDLPRGVYAGTVNISSCTGEPGAYELQISGARRFDTPIPSLQQPQAI